MTPIQQATWERLTLPAGEQLVARVALPEKTPKLLCALDSTGNRHLLISLESTEDEFADRQSRGVNVTTRELSIHGGTTEKYIDVICIDSSGHAIFDIIGGEIADELQDITQVPAETVRKVLSKWRRFWGQVPQPLLSREEQLGLFAEIWFFREWLFPKLGYQAIMAWHGPWGSRHDFEWSDKSVEVKATTSARGRIHKIHGLDQLLNPENGNLFLFSVSLRDEQGATYDLPSLIESCRSYLEGFDEGLMHFDDGLAQLGYSPIFDREYSSLKLRVNESVLFRVADDFPRLTPTSFVAEISGAIERIDYDINLNSYNHLILANRPDELSFFPSIQ